MTAPYPRQRLSSGPASTPRAARRVRVLYLTGSLHFGGAERQVVELARSLDRRRFEPVLCCLDGTRTLFDRNPSDTPLELAPRRSKFDLTVLPRVAGLLRRYRFDVLHSFLFDAEIIGRFLGRLLGVPLVVASERNSDYPPMPVKDAIQRLTRPLVDLVIANSHAGKEYACRWLHFPASRVEVVHNCVDTARFTPRSPDLQRRRMSLPSQGPVVGMFASFKQQKNHAMFLRVARIILDRRPGTRFLCVGHTPFNDRLAGAYEASLRRLAADLRVAQALTVLKDREDVEMLYGACDVTVLTSRREGTPNVVLESMACGVPVIATDVADNRLIIPPEAGGVVELDHDEAMAERVLRLLDHEEARREAGERARRNAVERFSIRAWADQFAALYESGLARKKCRAGAA